jgi:hypothetical protein
MAQKLVRTLHDRLKIIEEIEKNPGESRKEVKKKTNILEAMLYIMAAWQQITQQTIQNCFHKAGYKYQSNVNEMATDGDDDDDFSQDWEELCGAQKYDFQNYVSVDRDVATSGVSTV